MAAAVAANKTVAGDVATFAKSAAADKAADEAAALAAKLGKNVTAGGGGGGPFFPGGGGGGSGGGSGGSGGANTLPQQVCLPLGAACWPGGRPDFCCRSADQGQGAFAVRCQLEGATNSWFCLGV